MRDWAQAALFGADDAATESWTSLERDGQFTRDLEFDIRENKQSGTVTVRLPPQERDVAVSRNETMPATQRTPYRSELAWELRTSPSDLSGLAEGSVRWEVSEETRQARTVRTDDATESSGQRQGGLVTPDGTHLQADVFGQAVHRLCEVRPPWEEWPAFIRQVAAAQRNPGDTSPADIPPAAIEAVTTAAASALEYLETLHGQVEPLSTHDEFPISFAFDTVELTGYIDHLAVSEDTYYVVDYKTDRQRDEESISEFLDRRRAHHEPQVMAYAAALQAHDSTRDVDARLYFTDIDDSVRWTPGELESAQTSVRTLVSESLPNRLTVDRI